MISVYVDKHINIICPIYGVQNVYVAVDKKHSPSWPTLLLHTILSYTRCYQ